MKLYHRDSLRELGGPGSGNWGHAGRPGERGGSQKGTGGVSKSSAGKTQDKTPEVKTQDNKLGITKDDYWGHQSRDMNISRKEQDALDAYKALTSYSEINNALYRNDTEFIEYSNTIKQLDKVIKRATIESDVSVYSGLGSRASAILSGLDVGSEVDFKGYLSTSIDENIASDFSKSVNNVSRKVKINLPKGSKGFFFGNSDQEKEVLLGRGKKFKISDITSKKSGENTHITYHLYLVK